MSTVLPPHGRYNGKVPDLPVGTKGEMKIRVTPEIAVNFLGLDGARVLGTPYLIFYSEMTSRNSIQHLLDHGFDTVGIHVDVRHLAATPLGMEVTFRSELIAVEERTLRFRVEAFDEKEKICEGTHERAIINVAKFAARVQEKARIYKS